MYSDNLECIENLETKKMFKIILGEFYGDNYRSCVTSLYTLAIYDLVQKIYENIEDTQDQSLIKIRDAIDEKVVKDEKYSNIEKYIVEELCKKKKIGKILNGAFNNLREERNKCAHFGLFSDKLYIPTKNITQHYLEFFFSELFSKTSNMLSNVKSIVLNRIEDYYSLPVYDLSEEGQDKIKKDLNKLFYNSLHDKTINELHKTLFELAFIKDDNECIKYRKYTIFSLKCLIDYIKEYKPDFHLNYSFYSKLNEKILFSAEFESMFPHPIYSMINYDYIDKKELQNHNDGFMKILYDTLQKDYKILGRYWKIMFKQKKDLNEFLRTKGISLNDIVFFEIDDLASETIYMASKTSIENVPDYYGYNGAINCIDKFRHYYKKLNNEELKDCINSMNGSSQFYSCYSIRYFFDELKMYIENKDDIDENDFFNLFGCKEEVTC